MIRNLPYPQVFGYNRGASQVAPAGNTFMPPPALAPLPDPDARFHMLDPVKQLEEAEKKKKLFQDMFGFSQQPNNMLTPGTQDNRALAEPEGGFFSRLGSLFGDGGGGGGGVSGGGAQ